MIKGTTPTHVFNLPFETDLIEEVKITYSQSDIEVLSKTTTDCTFEGKTITLALTQEETLLFNHHKNVQIQVRVLTITNEVLASDIKIANVGKCLDNEVLV